MKNTQTSNLYFLTYHVIPNLAYEVYSGKLNPTILSEKEWILYRADYDWLMQRDDDYLFCGDGFDVQEIRQPPVYMILYTFPEPKEAPLAKFAILAIDIEKKDFIRYYTLEKTSDTEWVFGYTDISGELTGDEFSHFTDGIVEYEPTSENFIHDVFKRLGAESKFSRIANILSGLVPTVKTFGILTESNPLQGVPKVPTDKQSWFNNKQNKDLEHTLRQESVIFGELRTSEKRKDGSYPFKAEMIKTYPDIAKNEQKNVIGKIMGLVEGFISAEGETNFTEVKGGKINLGFLFDSIGLTVNEGLYNQVAYQFAHELTHIYCDPRTTNWFIESICEMASLYFLEYLSNKWMTEPPFEYLKNYSAKFNEYKLNRIQKVKSNLSISDETKFQEKFTSILNTINEPYNRDNNTIIALRLLEIFKKNNIAWTLLPFIGYATDKNLVDGCFYENSIPDFDKLIATSPQNGKEIAENIKSLMKNNA